jgi:hypothetical protein
VGTQEIEAGEIQSRVAGFHGHRGDRISGGDEMESGGEVTLRST